MAGGKNGVVEKRIKKEKDPNAPKRPQTAYFLWMGENRARIASSVPGMPVTEVAKAAGAEWKTVNDKSKWEKLAALDKVRYSKELAVYSKGK